MMYWVGTLVTGQVHAIFLRITEVWYELSKSKVKNTPGLVLNAKIAYAVLNVMLTAIKILWEEAPMGNFSTAFTADKSEDLTPFG